MLKQLRSRKATKRIMFWTLVLVIPSFVFFYGWQSSSQSNQESRAAIAKVKDRWWGLRWRPLTPADQDLAYETLENRYGSLRQTRGL